jgi:3D (Asp-Asp-Asp) domain-containing protein
MTTKNNLHKIQQFFSRQAKNILVLCLVILCLHLRNDSHTYKRELESCTSIFSVTCVDYFQEMKINRLLLQENTQLKKRLETLTPMTTRVKVTMYHPVAGQTDSSPNITADGTIIKINEASSYRYVAVSRDLLEVSGGHLNYGDYVILRGTGRKDGLYQVRDTMARRWTNRIDILESPSVLPYKFEEALLVYTALDN